jgi:DNA mismatch endonuclease (patch repair protein)
VTPRSGGDPLSPAQRSALMARIRGKDTGPERMVRSLVHGLGYRFRLHRRDLPGTPDLVLPRLRTAIFVHGCFWHRHRHCRFATTPATRRIFWQEKFNLNLERDRRAAAALRRMGWLVITVWECQLRQPHRVRARLVRLLGSGSASVCRHGGCPRVPGRYSA